jgi:hypothetical protein
MEKGYPSVSGFDRQEADSKFGEIRSDGQG